MISCLIVDDEPLSRDVLRAFVNDHPELELAGEAKDALDAMSLLNTKSVELKRCLRYIIKNTMA